MNFYAYKGTMPLGAEPLGTEGRLIRRDLNTVRGMRRVCERAFGSAPYSLYTFSNFFDDRTFRKL